ncbi:MAG: M20/M25/M40 family metallo-hydrolase, partial [Verrucomicrobiae bacterium]|nr:M20/M25/M40 family metallo-hydrolase [Verrucomicrobiae bacterium]
ALAFGPHTDTVGVRGMSIAPFTPVIRGDRLWGRGAADTKGALAAFLWAMKRLAASRSIRPASDVYFLGLMGEESGNDGAKRLMGQPRSKWPGRFDFAIMGEPTELHVVNAHKGALWLRLATRGRACHGARPEQGENAIYKMTRAVEWLRRRYAPRLARRRHPELGSATMNVGTIRGGSKVNIVPDHCEIEVDLRTLPGDDHARRLRRLRAELDCQHIQVINDSPGAETPAAHPFVRQLVAAGAGRCMGAAWFSDAAVFARHGVPAVAFGPGSIAQAHTPDEFTSVSQVERCVVVVEKFLANLA